MSTAIKLRGDTLANWTLNNPTILERETVVETDTKRFKIGTGAAYLSTEYTDKGVIDSLALKSPLASPTFTGTLICGNVNSTISENIDTFNISTVNNTAFSIDGEDGGVKIPIKATINNPTFTGTVTAPLILNNEVVGIDEINTNLTFTTNTATDKAASIKVIGATFLDCSSIDGDVSTTIGVRNSTGASDTVLKGNKISFSTRPFGANITLPVFADSAAAVTGGMITGEVYMTSIGQVMVVL